MKTPDCLSAEGNSIGGGFGISDPGTGAEQSDRAGYFPG